MLNPTLESSENNARKSSSEYPIAPPPSLNLTSPTLASSPSPRPDTPTQTYSGLIDGGGSGYSSKPSALTRLSSFFRRKLKTTSNFEENRLKTLSDRPIESFGNSSTPYHIRRLLREAHIGWKESQFSLGYCYDVGTNGVQPNTNEAIHWYALHVFTLTNRYEQAAMKDHPIAQNNLGVLHSTGHRNRIPQNWAEALHWYKKSASQGNANAQFHLGLAYMNGEGVDARDDTLAFEYFKKAGKQGHVLALSNVGAYYMSGRSVTKNYKKALKWLKKAVVSGDPVAAHNLAVMYERGLGCLVDRSKSNYYMMEALSQRHGGVISKELSDKTRKSGGTLYNS